MGNGSCGGTENLGTDPLGSACTSHGKSTVPAGPATGILPCGLHKPWPGCLASSPGPAEAQYTSFTASVPGYLRPVAGFPTISLHETHVAEGHD